VFWLSHGAGLTRSPSAIVARIRTCSRALGRLPMYLCRPPTIPLHPHVRTPPICSDSVCLQSRASSAGASSGVASRTPSRIFSQAFPSVTDDSSASSSGGGKDSQGSSQLSGDAAAAASARKLAADQRRTDRIDFAALDDEYREAAGAYPCCLAGCYGGAGVCV
jgi:hypothetical protein